MVGFRRGDADTVVLDDEVQETIHKAVEEFVGNAEPSDDLTKMCISSKLFFINQLCLSKQNRSELCELPSSLFLPFYFLCHARGHAQCRCNGRQHTNGCLNREFPKCLVLHNALVLTV